MQKIHIILLSLILTFFSINAKDKKSYEAANQRLKELALKKIKDKELLCILMPFEKENFCRNISGLEIAKYIHGIFDKAVKEIDITIETRDGNNKSSRNKGNDNTQNSQQSFPVFELRVE